jgi:hypothetical protein
MSKTSLKLAKLERQLDEVTNQLKTISAQLNDVLNAQNRMYYRQTPEEFVLRLIERTGWIDDAAHRMLKSVQH